MSKGQMLLRVVEKNGIYLPKVVHIINDISVNIFICIESSFKDLLKSVLVIVQCVAVQHSLVFHITTAGNTRYILILHIVALKLHCVIF